MFHLFISDSLYNKELIQYLISLYGEVILAYFSMPGTESDFYLLRFIFKLNLSKIRTGVFIYLYYLTYEQIFIVYFFVDQYETEMFIYF